MWFPLIVFLVILFFACIVQVNQYERAIKFTMGRVTGMMEPGWRIRIPVFQFIKKVDIRLRTLDLPPQDAITQDNISVKVNAVIYFKIVDPKKAIIDVQNVEFAVFQLAQTTMRNVVGEVPLDDLLSKRSELSQRIEKMVDEQTLTWGVEVTGVELKDINLPESMIRTIGKQAEAERERRAVIINSEGEVAAAANLSKAARMLAETPGALHLRTLNSINDISSDASNTIVFTIPMEILKAIDGFARKMDTPKS
ncbi:MAG: slipin family protein [Patescibacteria group bacterium]